MLDLDFMLSTTTDPRKDELLRLRCQFKKAEEKYNMESINLNELIYVCDYNEYSNEIIEEFVAYFKFIVVEQKMYLLPNKSPVHISAQSLINNLIRQAVDEASAINSACMVHNSTFPICGKYFCGSIAAKEPDGAIITYNSNYSQIASSYIYPQLVLEVAFTHEPLHMLFTELVHYLSEYVLNVNYAIGLWVQPIRKSSFRASFIILKRVIPSNTEKCNKFIEAYTANKKRNSDDYCKDFIKEKAIIYTHEFVKEFFNVDLQLKIDIDDDFIDSGANISFSLDSATFDTTSDVNVIISNEMLNMIRESFRAWARRYK